MLFFFQAEDGIRDRNVTGVKTCALPISPIQNASKRRIVMKRTLAMFLALILALSLVACGGNNTTGNDTAGNNTTANDTTGNDAATDDTTGGEASTVANADKPLVWFNRQPSNSSTGALDMAALRDRKSVV